ncbi:MAG TPA: hypothetical protein VN176_18920 [Verrucomicrobiae bacterium]|jgi:hypothetical protein|nr:hypothetical protein [Verrucomicrobiae bacterium]
MNLKTWLKGLGVFVLSSLVTALAATNLDPSHFNFSREGLVKLGTLVLIIAGKAVLLYFQRSPLQTNEPNLPGGPQSPATAKDRVASGAVASVLTLCLLLPSILSLTGCVNSWERSTYATLAGSKALIDCAIAGYNGLDMDIRQYCAASPGDPNFDPASFYIPRTREAQQVIEKARQVQTASVQAFEAYAVAKVAHDPNVSLAGKEAAVVSEITQLPQLISAVRALFVKAPAGKSATFNFDSAPQTLTSTIEKLEALKPITRSPDHGDHPISFPLEVEHGK